MDGIPPSSQPTPPNPRDNNNSAPIRLTFGGQQNQNQVNVTIMLKNLAWSTKK